MLFAFIYASLGLSTMLVFVFKREWLIERKPLKILTLWNIILFISGYILEYSNVPNVKAAVFIKVSLLSQIIHFIMLLIYRAICKKDPQDTFHIMDWSLWRDAMFNFIFWIAAILIPILLVSKRIV